MDGSFTITSVDSELFFDLLAVAPGCKPQFLRRHDPGEGVARFELEPRPDGEDVLHGRVVDKDGNPVLGAEISAVAMMTGNRKFFGQIPNLDTVAVTDELGDFSLGGAAKGSTYHVKVVARALAVGFFKDLAVAEKGKLELGEGATIVGRLTYDGEPLAGVSMGLIEAERSGGTIAGEIVMSTDKNGRFTFLNVQPEKKVYVYGKMEGMTDGIAVDVKQVSSPGHGKQTDMESCKGHRHTRSRAL